MLKASPTKLALHHPTSDGAIGLKQHSGATGASFAEAGLIPNWRGVN
ncbi:hypothetical protein [Microcoleus vaginatus]